MQQTRHHSRKCIAGLWRLLLAWELTDSYRIEEEITTIVAHRDLFGLTDVGGGVDGHLGFEK